MTEQDASDYRVRIANILNERSANWIVEQANEQMSLGKLQTKRIDASETTVDAITQVPRRSSRKSMAEFLFTVPYTEVEKLSILIEAIDLALIAPVLMEIAIPENLGSEIGIDFIPDEGASGTAHRMRPKSDESRNEARTKLIEAVSAIKALI